MHPGGRETPRYSIGPLVTLTVDADALKSWAREAARGETIVYAIGFIPPRDRPVWRAAASLCDMGLVDLVTRRRGDGQTEYLAQRKPSPIAISDDTSPPARVFAELARCAAAGEPMPTDPQLAKRCGLMSADQASYALRRLRAADAAARRVQVINWGPREHRQAIVLATGAMTPRRAFSERDGS